MMKSLCRLFAGSLLLLGLALAGCGGGDLDPGVPKDVGYVPIPPEMQPNMGAGPKKPVMGASDKERKDGAAAAAAADAAAIKNPPPK